MQQAIDRKGEESMISTEEYLRRKNVIRGKELENTEGSEAIHSRDKKEKTGEDTKKVNSVKWGAMMELAVLLCV